MKFAPFAVAIVALLSLTKAEPGSFKIKPTPKEDLPDFHVTLMKPINLTPADIKKKKAHPDNLPNMNIELFEPINLTPVSE